MAIYTAQHTLGTAPVRIVPPSTQPQEVHIHNMTKSSNEYIFLGNSNVSSTNSIHIDPGETIQIVLQPSQDLWGVSDPSGLIAGVLAVRKD